MTQIVGQTNSHGRMDGFSKFSRVKVLIVGDVMLDRYLNGEVTRISPEAPVPVVRLKNTNLIAGGAANVAANVAGLGATPFLIGVIGGDAEGNSFPGLLKSANVSADGLIKIENRQTTVKIRVTAHNQQIVRIDCETREPLGAADEEKVWLAAALRLAWADVVLISDYDKGVLSETLISRLIKQARRLDKFVVVDPKGKDYGKYKNATLITPNQYEVQEVCGLSDGGESSLTAAGASLRRRLGLEAVLITRGEQGMTLLKKDGSATHLTATARNVYDVTGAGDTVIAVMATALGAGQDFLTAAETANAAAGLAVEKVGTSIVKIEELKNRYEISSDSSDKISSDSSGDSSG